MKHLALMIMFVFALCFVGCKKPEVQTVKEEVKTEAPAKGEEVKKEEGTEAEKPAVPETK